MTLRVLSLALSWVSTAAQIDPKFSQKITVYHLNPLEAGAVPINMDTGDARGDLLFYLSQFMLPVECADPDERAKFDCSNPERFGHTVVTKVDMEVDDRWTSYSGCNLCNGTDPITHKPCEKGVYSCDCFNYHSNKTCDHAKVGRVNHTFGPDSHHHFGTPCNSSAKDFECWNQNIDYKIGGLWFSTLKEGMCSSDSETGSCSWKVLSTSTVNASCLKDTIADEVEHADKTECFSKLGARNYSSHAWVACFMDTVLGPESSYSTKIAGMPLEDIVSAWTKPFLPESSGGCPKLGPNSEVLVV